MREIKVYTSNTNNEETLTIKKNLIVVGANGSGKTRFGALVEKLNTPSKRISAQRYLQVPDVVTRQDYESADSVFKSSYKNQSPAQPQNDYNQAMISLYAQEAKRDSEYVKHAREAPGLDIPKSVKEQVMDIWGFVFPHRNLKLDNDRIKAIEDDSEFSGTEMSDGEKVGLYLITQVLLAEKNCILIIDEPELHLHKALMVRLWNKLEELRDDCLFVYITHDLDFAVSKSSSKLIWIQSYKNNKWIWNELDSNEIIPENLFLEVLGSRKPVLFVEGEKGSLDVQLYQVYYEDFTVIPRGSCEKVIESVKGLKDNSYLHDKKVFGLIDRDFRPKEQLDSLMGHFIFNTSLNKIENLFLIPEIIKIVCEYQLKPEKVNDLLNEIRTSYKEQKEIIKFAASKYRTQRLLNEKFGAINNNSEFEIFKNSIISELDQEFESIDLPDESADIIDILKVYPNKGLVRKVQHKIDMTKNGYQNLVIGLMISDKKTEITKVMSSYLPVLK